MVWTGLNWLRIGTSGGLLWTRWWIFGFLKIARNFLNGCTIGSFSGRAQLGKYVSMLDLLILLWITFFSHECNYLHIKIIFVFTHSFRNAKKLPRTLYNCGKRLFREDTLHVRPLMRLQEQVAKYVMLRYIKSILPRNSLYTLPVYDQLYEVTDIRKRHSAQVRAMYVTKC
jgi:hypothetical protein